MEKGTAQFIDYLFTVPNLLIVSSVWILLGRVRKSLPKVKATAFYARLEPLLPIILASAAVWVPGAVEDTMTIASRIFLGVVLGFLAAHGNKVFRQTALGRDRRIRKKAKTHENVAQ